MFDDMINKIRQRGELVIECYPVGYWRLSQKQPLTNSLVIS